MTSYIFNLEGTTVPRIATTAERETNLSASSVSGLEGFSDRLFIIKANRLHLSRSSVPNRGDYLGGENLLIRLVDTFPISNYKLTARSTKDEVTPISTTAIACSNYLNVRVHMMSSSRTPRSYPTVRIAD